MPRQNDVAQEVDTLVEFSDLNLFGMQRQGEMVGQKSTNHWYELFQRFTIRIKNNKVVGVASVVTDVQSLFHELVKFVQIHVRKKLRRKVSNRQTLAAKEWPWPQGETIDNFPEQPNCICVFDPAF